jgi:predicted dehydrogenase
VTRRVGIIGCGFIAGIHSRVLRGLHRGGLVDAPVVATCDYDIDRARSFADAHGAALATTDVDELLGAVDVAWICTPTSTHRALVEAAATAGVDVYCEKPLATSYADAAAMLDAVTSRGIRNQVGLVLRASPPIAEIQRLVADAALVGRPMAAILRDDQYFPIQGQYGSSWRADATIAGGGTLIEHSIHDLDVLAWVLGDVVEVSARTTNFAGHHGIEDVAIATLTHASSATSSLVSVWHGILSRPSTRRFEVFCEQGFLWIDDERSGPVHLEHDGSPRVIDPMPPEGDLARAALPDALRSGLDMYLRADRAFLDDLDAGRTPSPGIDVALAAHAVAGACYESAASGGSTVAVPRAG